MAIRAPGSAARWACQAGQGSVRPFGLVSRVLERKPLGATRLRASRPRVTSTGQNAISPHGGVGHASGRVACVHPYEAPAWRPQAVVATGGWRAVAGRELAVRGWHRHLKESGSHCWRARRSAAATTAASCGRGGLVGRRARAAATGFDLFVRAGFAVHHTKPTLTNQNGQRWTWRL